MAEETGGEEGEEGEGGGGGGGACSSGRVEGGRRGAGRGTRMTRARMMTGAMTTAKREFLLVCFWTVYCTQGTGRVF